MRRHLFFIVLALWIGVGGTGWSAQPDSLLGEDELVSRLAQAYNNFDYQKCAELLNIAFPSIETFSPKNRVEIYKYAAFIAFQQGNSTLASNHFWHLLEVDPSYSLDPVQTPPKLLALFRKTKIEFLEDLNNRLSQLHLQQPVQDVAWRSLLIPGWEQWHRGYRTKGVVLGAAALGSLSGLIYAAINTRLREKDYQNASTPEEAARLYQQYNRFYRQQFYFSYAYVLIWVASQVDITLWSQPRIKITTHSLHAETLHYSVALSLNFSL